MSRGWLPLKMAPAAPNTRKKQAEEKKVMSGKSVGLKCCRFQNKSAKARTGSTLVFGGGLFSRSSSKRSLGGCLIVLFPYIFLDDMTKHAEMT